MKNRNIILGIDGVPYELMDKLSDKNVMPNFKELKTDYDFKLLKSSIPHISSVSWSSIITGKNPGEHGIYGFTELINNSYTLSFPNFNALRSQPFWDKQSNKKHILINVPSTYPARELNGIHIAGFVALDLEKAVYPKEYINTLKNIGYEIDVDSKLAQNQSNDIFIEELLRILNIRKRTIDFLWNECEWNNFMPVITGSDRIGHFLWHLYENKTNQYHRNFLEYFHRIDAIIGDLWHRLKEDDTFIILSDHGMEQIDQNVYLNTYLEQEGFLSLSKELKKYNRVKKESNAFVLDPGRIYLNKKYKYPNGSIAKENENTIISELKASLYDLKYRGQKVIKKIYEKEEIYSGKMIDKAPDLVLVENKGFNLRGSIGKSEIFEKDYIFSGKHNENAFLFVNKELDIKEPTVEDVVGLLW